MDEVSVERLLKLTSEGKIKLYEQKIRLKKKRFDFGEDAFAKCGSDAQTSPVLSYIEQRHCCYGDFAPKDSAFVLKQLLAFEAEGKIPAHEIAEILKFKAFINPKEYKHFLQAIQKGEINSGNILQARLMAENGFSLNILNANSGAEKAYFIAKQWILGGSDYGNRVRNAYQELTSKIITENEYAKLYRIASNPKIKLKDVHSNKQIQQILGGEAEAKAFEDSISKINETFVSCEKSQGNGFVPEIVTHDLEIACIGTNRTASEIDYQLRKRYPLIVEF